MAETPKHPEPEENLHGKDPSGSPDEKKFKLGSRLKKGGGLPYGKNKLPSWSSRNGLWTWILFGVAVIMLVSVYSKPDFASKEVPYSEFKTKIKAGEIKKVVISQNMIKGF